MIKEEDKATAKKRSHSSDETRIKTRLSVDSLARSFNLLLEKPRHRCTLARRLPTAYKCRHRTSIEIRNRV